MAQTEGALNELKKRLPGVNFKIVRMDSPGDRDKETDLRETPPDFFTRDLDEAILDGRIDCAVHSAKDLPETLRDGLDFFYLPWREDPRDVIVLPVDCDVPCENPRIGVSNARREAYCRKKYPDARLLPIRGNVERRVALLDKGSYDLLVMAAAGLNRIGLGHRISEFIPLDELTPPDGQGALAMTFRKGDEAFTLVRKLFVKPVFFAGAGVGVPENATIATVNALRSCDVCLYDALCPVELLERAPRSCERLFVGKRKGEHSLAQKEICELIVKRARKGKRVVRLKGGDPGVFGRLAEEIDAMNEYELPFKVLPGVTSLNAATTGTGLLLTRRGLSRGFAVATARRSGSGSIEWFSKEEWRNLPRVFFMGVKAISDITDNLKREGVPGRVPVAVVYNAGSPSPTILCGSLNDIAEKADQLACSDPGVIIVGENADERFLYRENGVLNGMKVLFAGSRHLAAAAKEAIDMFGGRVISLPMIKLVPVPAVNEKLDDVLATDWLIVPSPSCAILLLDLLTEASVDIRRLPRIAVCGPGTAAIFTKRNVSPDVVAAEPFGAEGLVSALKNTLKPGERVLRLCSDEAMKKKTSLTDLIPGMENAHFYDNVTMAYEMAPEFESVLFTSSSSVRAFVDNFTVQALREKTVVAIGEPTFQVLNRTRVECDLLRSFQATIPSMVETLACWKVNQSWIRDVGGRLSPPTSRIQGNI